MSDEPTKEGRPPGVAEGTDPDTPQDPGIPGQKAEEEQGTQWEPRTTERGFPEGAEDDRAKREAAAADDTFPARLHAARRQLLDPNERNALRCQLERPEGAA